MDESDSSPERRGDFRPLAGLPIAPATATHVGRRVVAVTNDPLFSVRPMRADDDARLVRFHSRLSPRTTYLRYFSPHPRLSPEEVQRFTRVDHCTREAVVATVRDELIGVARYDRLADDPNSAEVAVVVEDAWQGHGVGTALLRALEARARAEGITEFVAATLTENMRMRAVFRHMGWPMTTEFDGSEIELRMRLDQREEARCS